MMFLYFLPPSWCSPSISDSGTSSRATYSTEPGTNLYSIILVVNKFFSLSTVDTFNMANVGRAPFAGKNPRHRRRQSSFFRASNIVLCILAFCLGLAVNRLSHYMVGGVSKPRIEIKPLPSSGEHSISAVDAQEGRLLRKPRAKDRSTRNPTTLASRREKKTQKQEPSQKADKMEDLGSSVQVERGASEEAVKELELATSTSTSPPQTLVTGPIVIDAFPFHHEYDMLELRLHEL